MDPAVKRFMDISSNNLEDQFAGRPRMRYTDLTPEDYLRLIGQQMFPPREAMGPWLPAAPGPGDSSGSQRMPSAGFAMPNVAVADPMGMPPASQMAPQGGLLDSLSDRLTNESATAAPRTLSPRGAASGGSPGTFDQMLAVTPNTMGNAPALAGSAYQPQPFSPMLSGTPRTALPAGAIGSGINPATYTPSLAGPSGGPDATELAKAKIAATLAGAVDDPRGVVGGQDSIDKHLAARFQAAAGAGLPLPNEAGGRVAMYMNQRSPDNAFGPSSSPIQTRADRAAAEGALTAAMLARFNRENPSYVPASEAQQQAVGNALQGVPPGRDFITGAANQNQMNSYMQAAKAFKKATDAGADPTTLPQIPSLRTSPGGQGVTRTALDRAQAAAMPFNAIAQQRKEAYQEKQKRLGDMHDLQRSGMNPLAAAIGAGIVDPASIDPRLAEIAARRLATPVDQAHAAMLNAQARKENATADAIAHAPTPEEKAQMDAVANDKNIPAAAKPLLIEQIRKPKQATPASPTGVTRNVLLPFIDPAHTMSPAEYREKAIAAGATPAEADDYGRRAYQNYNSAMQSPNRDAMNFYTHNNPLFSSDPAAQDQALTDLVSVAGPGGGVLLHPALQPYVKRFLEAVKQPTAGLGAITPYLPAWMK